MVDVSVGIGESTSYGRTIFHGTFEEYVAKLKQ
jgi:hypothetical protein